jgi:two-component system, chemotaxis family, sensor kinase CheA
MDEDIKAFLIDSYENLDQIERDLVALKQYLKSASELAALALKLQALVTQFKY